MNKEQSMYAIKVSSILFKNNVPVDEAKIVGSFIEKLCKENTNLKQALNEIREYSLNQIECSKKDCVPARKIACEHILQIINKVGGNDEKN